ncbi:MAG: cupin domain-containing protein [Nocardioides sp.]
MHALLEPVGSLLPAPPTTPSTCAVADLSCGTYSIPAGGEDPQSPHTEDELYVCTAGRATLWTPGGSTELTPGVVTFVPAGEEHRFVEVGEDFAVLVVFGPAEGSRGSADRTPGVREANPVESCPWGWLRCRIWPTPPREDRPAAGR